MRRLLLTTTLLLLLAGCRDSDRDKDDATYAALDNSTAANIFNYVFAQIHGATIEDTLLYGMPGNGGLDPCIDSVELITTGGSFPMTLNLDYGTVNSNCNDGKARRGQISILFTGMYMDSASTLTATLTDYYVNDFQVEGTMTITNKGWNANNNLVYAISLVDGVISNDTVRIEWDCNRTFEWATGQSTASVSDDAYSLSGTASGRTTKGNLFTVTIMDPLVVDLECDWIEAGKARVIPNNLSMRDVGYGSGACDNDATVNVNGKTIPIEMW